MKPRHIYTRGDYCYRVDYQGHLLTFRVMDAEHRHPGNPRLIKLREYIEGPDEVDTNDDESEWFYPEQVFPTQLAAYQDALCKAQLAMDEVSVRMNRIQEALRTIHR